MLLIDLQWTELNDGCMWPVTGISLLYFLCLLFAIYQKYDDVKEVMFWLYPELRDWKPDEKVRSTVNREWEFYEFYFFMDFNNGLKSSENSRFFQFLVLNVTCIYICVMHLFIINNCKLAVYCWCQHEARQLVVAASCCKHVVCDSWKQIG